MSNQDFAEPFDGLKENITLEMTKDRVIQNPATLNTTLEKLYDQFSAADGIHSYAGYSSATHIGFAELHGRRDAQEDRIAFGVLPHFNQLAEAKRLFVLEQTMTRLTHVVSHANMHRTGSTLCATVIDGTHLYTINVGDSAAYLAVIDSNGDSVHFKRLNTILHHPTEPSEKKRLEKAGKEGFIHHKRLMGLALSRAMGDSDLEPFGLIHTADLYSDKIEIPKDGHAFVVVACDGLTEGNCLAENKQEGCMSIEGLIQENYRSDPKKIAKILSHQAIAMDSGDNISILVTEIGASFTPTYMAVFDGHGGTECSELLRKHFHAVLVDEIDQALAK